MVRMFVFTLSLLAFSGMALAQVPNASEFSQEMTALLKKQTPELRVVPDPADPLHLVATRPGEGGAEGAVFNIYLDRIRDFCSKFSKEDCQATKARFARAMTEPQQAATLRSLRIIVRGGDYAEQIARLRTPDGKSVGFVRPIGESLYEILAVDASDTIGIINDATLETLQMTEAQAWDLAAVQTRAVVPRIPKAADILAKWQAFKGGDYTASIARDIAEWRAVSAEVGPNLFMTVASDDFLLIGVLPDGPDLSKLAESVQADCVAAARCISPHVYRFREGRWVSIKPPA